MAAAEDCHWLSAYEMRCVHCRFAVLLDAADFVQEYLAPVAQPKCERAEIGPLHDEQAGPDPHYTVNDIEGTLE